MPVKKTWKDKLLEPKEPKVKKTTSNFADVPANSQLLIPTPQLIQTYLNQIPEGNNVAPTLLRKDLAAAYQADYTCPVTTGIFLRIVAEAAFEEHVSGKPIKKITPFWRVIEPGSTLAKKLSCGTNFIATQRKKEGIA